MHFGDIPKPYSDYEKAKFVIIPVPYDRTSTWGKGADKGPDAILNASANMELFDIESDSEPYRKGIFTDKPVTENGSPEKMVKAVEKITAKHIEKKNINKKRVFFAHKIHDRTDWIKKAVSLLTNKVYLTIDLDVFDPSILPSTGTPEPGGMGWYEVLELIKAVAQKKKIVGFDIVELAPNPNNKASDFLAAKLAYYIMSLV